MYFSYDIWETNVYDWYYVIMEKNIIDELDSKSHGEIFLAPMIFISNILSLKIFFYHNYDTENIYLIVVALIPRDDIFLSY